MNKYQEALNKLKHRGERFGQDLYDTAKDEIDILQDLIDQNKPLTLEECIREWRKRDFDFFKWGTEFHCEISNVDETICFTIIKIEDEYLVDNHCCEYVKPEIIHLLSKTLKALEKMKDE